VSRTEPKWVQPIKEASRARARARAVAEVQSNRPVDVGSLKVTNGLSVLSSSGASVSTRSILPVVDETLRPPTFPGMPPLERTFTAETIVDLGEGTTRIPRLNPRIALSDLPASFDIPDPTPTDDPARTDSDSDLGLPRNFVPSLSTIERAVAAKVYFETHYHALLRKPRDRDTRKAMLETELSRLNITDAERRNVRAAWALSETEYLREMRHRVGIGSFVKLSTIGHGAFGVVSLVKERGTGE
jgi:protein-serine/threonine kinase